MTDTLKRAAKKYLESHHATLWGRSFDIKKEGGSDEAADWLVNQMRAVLDVRQELNEEPVEIPGQLPFDLWRQARHADYIDDVRCPS